MFRNQSNYVEVDSFIEGFEKTWLLQDNFSHIHNFPEITRREIYLPNQYYGIDLIIKNLLQIPANKSLKFAMPHGVEMGINLGPQSMLGIRSHLSTLIYNNEFGLSNIMQDRLKGFRFQSVHPILIIDRLMKSNGLMNYEKNYETLFYPAHSDSIGTFVNVRYDIEIIEGLLSQGYKPEEVTVSLIGADIVNGRNNKYEDFGFKVVSSGFNTDPFFFSRFINLASSFRSIVTSEIGSHLFFTAALGYNVKLIDLELPTIQTYRNPQSNSLVIPLTLFPKVEEFISLLGNEETQATAIEILGGAKESSFSIARLKKIHHVSIVFDIIGFLTPRGKSCIVLALPAILYRRASFLKSLLMKFLRM